MIRGHDRVAGVLERDESLLEVFVAVSPHFRRLRDPRKRRLMARLVTVSQAARIAGVDPALLLERLNRAARDGVAGSAAAIEPQSDTNVTDTALPPRPLAELAPERITDLDVRDDLRNGLEPFQRIMNKIRALPPGAVLRLRAIFEPVPLYHVLGRQGFAHWTEQLASDDWRVWFHRSAGAPAGSGADDPGPAAAEGEALDDGVVVLDVRGLEPPEPMVRTLAALEQLEPGKTLVQINVRVPQFLLPKLEELGYSYEVREQNEELVRLFIRRS